MNKAISIHSAPIANGKYYLLLFIIWPFLAFITAIFNYGQKEAKKVVYIFLVYYGLTFVLGNSGVDAERYALNLIETAKLPFSEFFNIVGGLYSDTTVDIVQPLVTFIVSRFTNNVGILFAVWAAIFGFFYLKSINLFYDRYRINPDWKALIIFSFFIMVLPIITIGGVRMPIATWMFFYGAFHVVLYRDVRYFILTLAAPLVHWSFLTANAILLIYFFAGNRNLIYTPIAVLSFVLPQLLAPLFRSLALGFGGAIQSRYEGYSSEGYIQGIQESYEHASWFITLSSDLLFYYLIFAIIIIQLSSKSFEKGKEERNLFSFLLLFLSFVNFGNVIPTFGGRFQRIFYLFATLYIFLSFLKIRGKTVNLLTWVGIFPMALYAAKVFRIGSISISAWILTPGMGLPLALPVFSIADLLF